MKSLALLSLFAIGYYVLRSYDLGRARRSAELDSSHPVEPVHA